MVLKFVQLCVWFIVTRPSLATEQCGDIRFSVHSGIIRLPDLSGQLVEDLNCSWTYTAPADRKLLVKVDSVQLPPAYIRTSSLQLFVDNQQFDIPRNCVKCLTEMVGGQKITVTFLSIVSPFNASLETDYILSSQTVGSFQIRFKSFDPYRCDKPTGPDNGYVIEKGWKLHQEIFYHCNPPYDIIGDSNAICAIPKDSPVPEWSALPPKCIIRNCSKGTIHRDAGAGAIANPGYPTRIIIPPSPCQWEIETRSGHIQVLLTYLRSPPNGQKFERVTRIALYDGSLENPIPLPSSNISQSFNFTTRAKKLIVQFSGTKERKEGGKLGFYLEYSSIKTSCPDPGPPVNGELVAYSFTVGSIVSYRCMPGYILIGESHAECLQNGHWSTSKPSCDGPVSVQSETLMTASNSSDTVRVNFTETPIPSKPTNAPKRNKSVLVIKTPTKQPSIIIPKTTRTTPRTSEQSITKSEKKAPSEGKKKIPNGGPKSEPHLQQIVPPKQPSKPKEHQQPNPGPNELNPKLHTTETQDDNRAVGVGKGEGEDEREADDTQISMTMIIIIAGVAGPLFILFIILIVLIVYRKRYPVRMRFGRKFSTFENPLYVKKDAQHPRELKRLTT